jgi:hypothetical protein
MSDFNPYQAQSEEELIQQLKAHHAQNQSQQPFDVNKGKSELDKLSKLKVKTADDAKNLVNHFSVALQMFYPNGFGLYDTWRPQQDRIYDVLNPPNPKQAITTIVAMFQAMKKFAINHQLQELNDAVTQSAYWYHVNIEKPKNPSATLASYGTNEQDPAIEKAKKKEKKSKYIKWGVIGGSVLVGATMLYFAFFHKPKPKKKPSRSNPRKRISSGVGKVTSGRVRKRNRKAPVKARSTIKRNPVIPQGSSLAQYRKKYEQEKKMKAKATRKRANRKPLSRKPATKSRGLRLK